MYFMSLWKELGEFSSLYVSSLALVFSAEWDLTLVSRSTLFANSTHSDLICVTWWILFFSSSHCSVTLCQTCKYSSWSRIARQPPKIILQPRRGAKKLCRKIRWDRVTVGKFPLTSFSYLSLWQWVQRRGWERERVWCGVLALRVKGRLWSWLAVGRQQRWKGTAGPEIRAALVMHVTSMRPRQEKLGTGSVPHPLPVSLLGALTPVFTTVICLVFLCLCIRLFFPSKRPLLLYSFYNGHYSSVTLSLFLSSLSLSKLFTTH